MWEDTSDTAPSYSIFWKNIATLTNLFKQNVFSYLPDHFAIVFDGHTTPGGHWVAYFATFFGTALGYRSVCLAVSPFEDETTLDTDEYLCFLKCVLNLFEKNRSIVVTVIEDIRGFDHSMSKRLEFPLLAWASHRFQLVVNKYWLENILQELLKTLRTALQYTKLWQQLHFKPVLKIETGWNSTYQKLICYVQIRHYVLNFKERKQMHGCWAQQQDAICTYCIKTLKDLEEVKNITKSMYPLYKCLLWCWP